MGCHYCQRHPETEAIVEDCAIAPFAGCDHLAFWIDDTCKKARHANIGTQKPQGAGQSDLGIGGHQQHRGSCIQVAHLRTNIAPNGCPVDRIIAPNDSIHLETNELSIVCIAG